MRELSAIERIERKWSLHNANKTQFYIAILRSNFHFNKEYESRNVNSIYFDDSDLNSLYENIDGNTYKAKYRVRWYGNFTQINLAKFEIKMKKGILSKKKFFKIKNEKMNLNQDSLKILTNEVNKILKFKKKIQPILSTHYSRDYFISANKKIRATVDDNLQSIKLLNFGNIKNKKNFNKLVLELKYDAKYDSYVRKNLNNLNELRLSKNSKYLISAMENIFTLS